MAPPDDAPTATAIHDLGALLGGIWMTIGLAIDGYAHVNIIDTATEDFITPWHGIFYAGFAVTAAWLGWVLYENRRAAPIREWIPPGYGLSIIGLGVFAVGGVGDGIWHTVFGVETGIDALLSPTHLVLFVGMFLILTTPLRSAWRSSQRSSGWLAAGSLTVTTTLVAFFMQPSWGLGRTWPTGVTFEPATNRGEEWVAFAVSTALVSSAVLLVPTLYLLRRFVLPPGAVVVLWTVPAAAQMFSFGFEWELVPPVLLGATVFEMVILGVVGARWFSTRQRRVVAAASLSMLALWSGWMLAAHIVGQPVVWQPELWSGLIITVSLAAAGLAAAVFPPPSTGSMAGEGSDCCALPARGVTEGIRTPDPQDHNLML